MRLGWARNYSIPTAPNRVTNIQNTMEFDMDCKQRGRGLDVNQFVRNSARVCAGPGNFTAL